jgi:DNA-binding MarR family transcriptional regulator
MQDNSDIESKKSGLTLADLQALPQQQKQILNWIRQQDNCSLLDLAVHFCQDEETIFNWLNPLVKRGFVSQNLGDNDNIYYQVQFPPKRPRQIPTKLLKKKEI